MGRLGGKQEILIGSVEAKCKVGNLIHELGHTLGFFHEHSRPDRDDFVRVALEKVRPGEPRMSYVLCDSYMEFHLLSCNYAVVCHQVEQSSLLALSSCLKPVKICCKLLKRLTSTL